MVQEFNCFFRLHALPKRWRKYADSGHTQRADYYYKQSRERFEQRDDAYIFDPPNDGLIGKYESIRFIEGLFEK